MTPAGGRPRGPRRLTTKAELVEGGHELVEVGDRDALLPCDFGGLDRSVAIAESQLHQGPHPIIDSHGDFHHVAPPGGLQRRKYTPGLYQFQFWQDYARRQLRHGE